MDVRYTVGKNEYRRMTTQELRDAFLNTRLYQPGKVNLMYCEVERGIAGFAVPTTKALSMPAGKEIASDYFCERRELGVLNIGGDNAVKSFREKNLSDGAPINAGYMVLNPEVFNYISGDESIFEQETLEQLVQQEQLMSYMHKGFWQCMDTKREMDLLEHMLESGAAPWKKWED